MLLGPRIPHNHAEYTQAESVIQFLAIFLTIRLIFLLRLINPMRFWYGPKPNDNLEPLSLIASYHSLAGFSLVSTKEIQIRSNYSSETKWNKRERPLLSRVLSGPGMVFDLRL